MIKSILAILAILALYCIAGNVELAEPKLIPCTTDYDCMVKNPHIDY